MAIERNPKKITKAVRLLTDPTPEFVSLVRHGANQEPFRVVRFDKAAALAHMEGRDMPKPENTMVVRQDGVTIPASGVEVARITLTGDGFPDESAVTALLEERGYSGFTVTKTDDGFTADPEKVSKFDGEVQDIDIGGGVVLSVGRLAEAQEEEPVEQPEAPATDLAPSAPEGTPPEGTAKKVEPEPEEDPAPEPAKKTEPEPEEDFAATRKAAPQLAKRYDSFMAMFSSATSVEGVMRDGADGLPPGMFEITDAMFVALRNAMSVGDNDAVSGITSEFGEFVVKLAKLFPFATVDNPTEVDRAAPAHDPKDQMELITKAMTDAMAPVMRDVAAIRKTTDDTATTLAEVGETVEKMGARVGDLERVSQTRKGADAVEGEVVKPVPVAKDPLKRGLFGISQGQAG